MMPNFDLEHQTEGKIVAGVDEVGRGPWAGPVLAAAVILNDQEFPDDVALKLDDSKTLNRKLRQTLYHQLGQIALIGTGQASVAEIESLNILAATLLAMRRAVGMLPVCPDIVLVDGQHVPDFPMPARNVVGGDHLCFSIAAASVIAKIRRDRLMERLAAMYPGYGWERNAGYGTAEHRQAIHDLGLTIQHRRGFRPIRERIAQGGSPNN